MKISKLLTIALLFACSLFTFSPATAKDHDDDRDHHERNDDKHDKDGSSLPIDNQVWFLIVAGAAVGCTVIIKKNKKTIQTAKL